MNALFFWILPLLLLADTTPTDLHFPGAQTNSEPRSERYDMLEVRTKEGSVNLYGTTMSQSFTYPQALENHQQQTDAFFARQLGLDASTFFHAYSSSYAHFQKDGQEYYLKQTSYASSYSYVLLQVTPAPEVVSLPAPAPYRVMKGNNFEIPEQVLIPEVEGFAISRAHYVDYDEIDFRYAGSAHNHKGKYWKLEFSKTAQDSDNYRFIVAHDYKAHLEAMGAEILKDEDNSFVFKLGDSLAQFSGYNTTFSLQIIQEEAFEQALVLAPDSLKTELDKSGRITLDGIFFDFDQATLKPESRKAILSAVALMQRYDDLVLSIHGYTDAKGDDAYNAALSLDRARAVMEAMIEESVGAARLSFHGHGEEDPVATNDTDEGRAQNRRVELHKESGGNQKSVITIDFIKPLENSVITEERRYDNSDLSVEYTRPYSEEPGSKSIRGQLDVVSYEIQKDGRRDAAFSRKAIIKNYENVLELYNAKIVGSNQETLSFEILDRGDGKHVYGRINAYEGSYIIRFLIEEKE